MEPDAYGMNSSHAVRSPLHAAQTAEEYCEETSSSSLSFLSGNIKVMLSSRLVLKDGEGRGSSILRRSGGEVMHQVDVWVHGGRGVPTGCCCCCCAVSLQTDQFWHHFSLQTWLLIHPCLQHCTSVVNNVKSRVPWPPSDGASKHRKCAAFP